jgi:DNA recombination protein RmuC
MNQETRNLTEALKGQSKIQGNWGEVILERILEKSGLRKDFEYFTQVNYTNESGRRQLPDMVVQLPNQRHVVIDSKMSLTAYERYSSARDEPSVKEALKAHLLSVRKHVKELSEKKYEQIHQINSLDFVLMIIPLESAFTLAVQHDHQLYYDAFDHNVIIVSPMTLLATTRTISNVWKQENQSRHAIEIADLGGKMFDKFVSFVHDLENIGNKLQAADNAYNDAIKKLSTGRGNLLTKASKLKDMGVKASKKLPDKYNLNE